MFRARCVPQGVGRFTGCHCQSVRNCIINSYAITYSLADLYDPLLHGTRVFLDHIPHVPVRVCHSPCSFSRNAALLLVFTHSSFVGLPVSCSLDKMVTTRAKASGTAPRAAPPQTGQDVREHVHQS